MFFFVVVVFFLWLRVHSLMLSSVSSQSQFCQKSVFVLVAEQPLIISHVVPELVWKNNLIVRKQGRFISYIQSSVVTRQKKVKNLRLFLFELKDGNKQQQLREKVISKISHFMPSRFLFYCFVVAGFFFYK